MSDVDTTVQQVEEDIWHWIRNFVTVKNAFYDFKWAPCPYASKAVQLKTVDVKVWDSGSVKDFIRQNAFEMRVTPTLTTRVMVFPPKTRLLWGLHDYVDQLNAELIPLNIFLNPGVAQTTQSRYSGSSNDPYFIVVANSLEAVLQGAQALEKTEFYKKWAADHYAHVVERRSRMAKKYGGKK